MNCNNTCEAPSDTAEVINNYFKYGDQECFCLYFLQPTFVILVYFPVPISFLTCFFYVYSFNVAEEIFKNLKISRKYVTKVTRNVERGQY
jgi:hypothetical protein